MSKRRERGSRKTGQEGESVVEGFVGNGVSKGFDSLEGNKKSSKDQSEGEKGTKGRLGFVVYP